MILVGPFQARYSMVLGPWQGFPHTSVPARAPCAKAAQSPFRHIWFVQSALPAPLSAHGPVPGLVGTAHGAQSIPRASAMAQGQGQCDRPQPAPPGGTGWLQAGSLENPDVFHMGAEKSS